MTFLHYEVCELGHDWILACESRPIATYANRDSAMKAATFYLAAAEKRGDVAVLETHDEHRGLA